MSPEARGRRVADVAAVAVEGLTLFPSGFVDERGVVSRVVVLAQAGQVVVLPARSDRCGVERVDRLVVGGPERDVDAGRGLPLADPEPGLAVASNDFVAASGASWAP